jgi:hypothetical protein
MRPRVKTSCETSPLAALLVAQSVTIRIDAGEDVVDLGVGRASHDRDRYGVVEVRPDLARRQQGFVLDDVEFAFLAAGVRGRELPDVEGPSIDCRKCSLDERHERVQALETVNDLVAVPFPLGEEDRRDGVAAEN